MRQVFRRFSPLVLVTAVVLALVLLFSFGAGAAFSAQDDAKQPVPDNDGQMTEQMMRFLADQQPPLDNVTAMPLTPCVAGMAGIYPCNNVDLLAFMPLADIGGGNGNDSWGWTDSSGREFAIMGRTNGTAFVEITDPINPVYLGDLPPHGADSSWRDVKVYDDYAFVGSEASGHGMQIFDLTELLGVVAPPVTFSETAHFDGFGSSHNIVINEDSGYAYGVGTGTCSAGLHMVDISDPLNPTDAGCFSADGYTHDAQCVIYNGPDVTYQGSEICLNANEDTLTVVDVTDKNNPVQLDREGYAGSGYTHQGWLTEDHSYFLLDDELDEQGNGHNTRTYMWDVQDLDNIVLINSQDGPVAAIDHNQYVKGTYSYQANYTSGLRIQDISDVANGNIAEEAFFDTYPSSDAASFNGAWSTFPFYDSGVVIISDINSGLFIVRPNLASFTLTALPSTLNICQGDDALYDVDVIDGGSSDPVTLVAVNVPAGASHSFSVNPVIPTGSSILTISNTAAVAAGSYAIDVSGSNLTDTLTTTVNLVVSAALPVTPTLTSPVDGASGVSLVPTYEWTGDAQTYLLEVATDMGMTSVVYSATVAGTSHTSGISLAEDSDYYWQVTGSNACGTSVASTVFSFTTRQTPSILLVDDDDNSPDMQPTYVAILDGVGVDYDIYDTAANGSNDPSTAVLAPYTTIIWFTGDDFSSNAGPNATGEAALSSHIDSTPGSCLFMSSQDYLWGQGGGGADTLTAFMMDYLGAASANSDVTQTTVEGINEFAGLGPYNLSYPFTNFSDDINPDGTAAVAFTGNAGTGNAAISKIAATYRTTWWGFPLEAVPTQGEQEAAMGTVLDWCAEGGGAATGTLNGTVTDANTGDPLDGATVEAGMAATMTDATGVYTLTLGIGTITVTASADGYESAMAMDVEILTDTVTIQDFALNAPSLTVDPTAFDVTVSLGTSTTLPLDLINGGATATDFELTELDGGFAAPLVSLPASDGNFPRGSYAASAGLAPADGVGVAAGEAPADLDIPLGSDTYAWNSQSGPYYTIFDLDVPGTLPNIVNFDPGGNFVGAGEYVEGAVIMIDTGNTLYAFEPASGAQLYSAPISPVPGGGETFSGLAYDPTSGVVYGSTTNVSTSSLYTVDVATGAISLIGPITNSPGNIGIAIDGAGNLWGFDIVNDSFFAIDKATGAGTNIGSLGYDANFGQGMCYDAATDAVYLVAFNNGSFQGELRLADPVTGNTTLVGVLGDVVPAGLNQLGFCGTALAGGGGDIPWLAEDPITGTVDADSMLTVDLTFDASVVSETGTYTGTLTVNSDDPLNPMIDIPVVMHVIADAAEYGVTLATTEDEMQAEGGETIVYDVAVTNTGNVDDAYTLTLSGNAWTTSLSDSSLILGPGETTTVTVTVEVPAGSMGESDTVTVTATSDNDAAATDALDLTTSTQSLTIWLPLTFTAPSDG